MKSKSLRPIIFSFILTLLLILVLLPWRNLLASFSYNQAAALSLTALLKENHILKHADDTMQKNMGDNCRGYWYQGVMQTSINKNDIPYAAWEAAIDCDPRLITILQSKYPQDSRLAEYAVATQPESAEGWFWLGDLQPERRLEYYQHGLLLSPNDGRRWIILGDMLRDEDPQAAVQAYLRGCFNGDPGSNGCLRAGGVSEQNGDYQSALKYYRLSSYIGSHNRADALEQRLERGELP